MSSSLVETVVRIGESSLSAESWLRRLHGKGGLLPLLTDYAVEEFLVAQAAAAGLSVPTAELQNAANRFRLRHGLSSAAATQAWLERQRLTADDWETALERDLLVARLRDHVTRDGIAGRFADRREAYARSLLKRLVVAREDLASELLVQIREEGADFSALAQRHSLPQAGQAAGQQAVVMRRDLSPRVAEAVFTAQPGEVVGPLATPQGFWLVLVEGLQPPELDAETTAVIREELFVEWLRGQVQGQAISFPLLDLL